MKKLNYEVTSMYKIKCECTSVAHLTINYFQMGLCMVYLSLVKYDVHETPRYLNFLGKKMLRDFILQ